MCQSISEVSNYLNRAPYIRRKKLVYITTTERTNTAGRGATPS